MSALLYLTQASLGKDATRLGMGLRMGPGKWERVLFCWN